MYFILFKTEPVKSSHSDINLCQATVASKVPEQKPPSK